MTDNKDLESLLKNIQKGLRVYSVKELNDALTSVLNKKDDKYQEVEYTFKIVSEHFKVQRAQIIKSKKHDVQPAKKIVHCLLHFDLNLTYRKIANEIFFTDVGSVQISINYFRNLNLNLKQDKYFYDWYSLLQGKLLQFVNENKKVKEEW